MTPTEKPHIYKAPLTNMWVCQSTRYVCEVRGFGNTPEGAYESWSGKWYVWQESKRVYGLHRQVAYHLIHGR